MTRRTLFRILLSAPLAATLPLKQLLAPKPKWQQFDPELIRVVTRAMPNLIAYDICGVQPMTGPAGLIFSVKSHYAKS